LTVARIVRFIVRAIESLGIEEVPVDGSARAPAFDEAMDDDINTPQAIAVIHGVVRDGNTALAAGDRESVRMQLGSVVSMLDALGLNPLAENWMVGRTGDRLVDVVDDLVRVALDQRQAARERKDYAAADAIRDQLSATGIVIEDTPTGPRWSVGESGDGR
jgi:Cysteinyl-tRNA synthetase